MNADLLISKVLNEAINWVTPHEREGDEATYQADVSKGRVPDHLYNQLQYLSNPENFRSALAGGHAETYSKKKFWKNRVGNTEASVKRRQTAKDAVSTLEPAKQKRASNLIRAGVHGQGSVEMPIILRHKGSGHEHLLAGNTRATTAIAKGHNVRAHVIEYN